MDNSGVTLRQKAHEEWVIRDRESRYERTRARHLEKTYGLSLAEYDLLFDQQAGLCAICRGVCVTGRRLAVDHDHVTGQVRGLLCSRCNFGIGSLRNLDNLHAALAYLQAAEENAK